MAARKKVEEIKRTVFIKPRQEFIQKLSEKLASGELLYQREVLTTEQLEQLETDFYNWNDLTKEILKQYFNRPDNEYYYKYSRINTMSGFLDYTRGVDTDHPHYKLNQTKSQIKNCLNELNQLIGKSELIDEDASLAVYAPGAVDIKAVKTFYNIGFVVHGHNDAIKNEVARFIENDLKRKAIILHEQPNKGRTIIEKFEHHANVDFAVALWTADDIGKCKSEQDFNDRARQNVIFETGFFIGKLGRSNVVVLYENGVEIPSDYQGVIFILFGGNWKDDLRKEIDAIYEI